jgi:hypothetical protein
VGRGWDTLSNPIHTVLNTLLQSAHF